MSLATRRRAIYTGLASTSERKLERAKLYRELVGALTGPLSALLPDPEPQLLSWRQRMGQLRQLLNLLCIGLCEYLGPVVADQCLTQAAQQVEALHLAFAPRKLL